MHSREIQNLRCNVNDRSWRGQEWERECVVAKQGWKGGVQQPGPCAHSTPKHASQPHYHPGSEQQQDTWIENGSFSGLRFFESPSKSMLPTTLES